MDKENQREGHPDSCLVCGKSEPEKEWMDETYEAQPCRFCSPHCQARFEASPQSYVAHAEFLLRPLGYS
jgi:YHS domain-containing protein